MATQGYEAVFVLKETKKKLKVMCAKEGKTFDQEIQDLMNLKRDIQTQVILTQEQYKALKKTKPQGFVANK